MESEDKDINHKETDSDQKDKKTKKKKKTNPLDDYLKDLEEYEKDCKPRSLMDST